MPQLKRLTLLVLLLAAILVGTAEIHFSEDLYRDAKERTIAPADDFISRSIQRFNDSWQWAFLEFDLAKQKVKEIPEKIENDIRQSVRSSVDDAVEDAKKDLTSPGEKPSHPESSD